MTPDEAGGPLGLTAEVLLRVAPDRAPGEVVAPVLATAGRPAVRAERSRPGWLVDGAVDPVPWRTGVTHLAVWAVEEGDNEVLLIVPVGAPGVTLVPVGDDMPCVAAVALRGVEVADADAVVGLRERPVLEDRLTLLAVAEAVGCAERLLEIAIAIGLQRAVTPEVLVDVAAARATAQAARDVVASPRLVERSRAVSSAVTYALPACARVSAVLLAGGLRGEEPGQLVGRLETLVAEVSPAWHRGRLSALL